MPSAITTATKERIAQSASSKPIIYEGATQGELAHLFGMSSGDVKARISGVSPCGYRNGFEIWKVRDVAPRLAKLPGNVIERVARMHPNDLPKMLAKEYWLGQKNRLDVMMKVGDLWDTRAVVDNCGYAFKTMRMSLMLLTDTVDREVGLTDKQRDIIKRLVNTLLYELEEKLVDGFSNRREHSFGKSFAPREDDEIDDL